MAARKRKEHVAERVTQLERERKKVLEVAPLQRELRDAFLADFKASPETPNAYYTRIGGPSSMLARVVEGAPAGKGKVLDSIAKHLGKRELGQRIKRLMSGIPPRQVALTVFSDQTIATFFDLHEAYARVSYRFKVDEFAQAFSPHETIVIGVFNCNLELIREIEEKPELRDFLLEVITRPGWSNDLEKIRSVHRKRLIEKSAKLRDLVDKLPCANRREQAELLKISHTSLKDAVNRGEGASEKTLDMLIERSREILDGRKPHGKGSVPKKKASGGQVKKTKKETGPSSDVGELLDQRGGEISALGIKHVLTKGSFRLVRHLISRELIDLTKRCMEITRGLLNVVAQEEDLEVLKEAQQKLGREIEAMYLTLEVATSGIPNNTVEMHERQGRHWEGLPLQNTSSKPRKRGG